LAFNHKSRFSIHKDIYKITLTKENMIISDIPSRLNITAKFSNFLVWEEKQNYITVSWQKDVKLVKNIVDHQLVNLDENQCFIYWLNRINSDVLAKSHLIAYLDWNCYWVVKNFFDNNNIYVKNISEVEKYLKAFNILRDTVTNSDKLIKEFSKFNPTISHINTYSQRWLKNVIRDGIYQEYGIGKYTFWGLLKNSTKTNLEIALKNQGYSQEYISIFVLLLQCFQQVYNGVKTKEKGGKLVNPTPENIKEILNLYQSLPETNLSMVTLKNEVNISPKFFETAMKKCHDSLTNYKKIQRPSAYSYHLPMQSENNDANENNTLTLETVLFRKKQEELKAKIDELKAKEADSLFGLLDKQEVNLILVKNLQTIKNNDYKKSQLLALNYGLGLKQSTIAELLNSQQSKVSREKTKITGAILKTFVREVQTRLQQKENIKEELKVKIQSLISPELNSVKNSIEHWLNNCYEKPFYLKLQDIFLGLESEQKTLVILKYGGDYQLVNEKHIGLNNKEIALRFNLTEIEVDEKLANVKKILKVNLITYVNNKYKINIAYDNQQIDNFLEQWFYQAPYGSLNS